MVLIPVRRAILIVLHVRILDLIHVSHVIFRISLIIKLVHLTVLVRNGKIKETRVTQFALLVSQLANDVILLQLQIAQNVTLDITPQGKTLLVHNVIRLVLHAQDLYQPNVLHVMSDMP